MPNNRAKPRGYMSVGEIAKKMGVTVRLMQYYDREGLLKPSAQSEGGRRLYTDQDVVKLHQILSMKYLGFSLDDIKNRLIPLETPADVAKALTEQARFIREKMAYLTEALHATEALAQEALQMEKVDFKKYADIIVNLQMKNEFYWMIKHFDDKTLDFVRERFDKDSGHAMMQTFKRLQDEAIRLHESKTPPESAEGQRFAGEFWDMIMEFSNGDMGVVSQLSQIADEGFSDGEWKKSRAAAAEFIEPALDAYFKTHKIGGEA